MGIIENLAAYISIFRTFMNNIASKIENWLTGMQMVQMFSFGGQSHPNTPSPAPSNYELGPGPRRKLCREIPVIPIDNIWIVCSFRDSGNIQETQNW